MFSEKLSNKAAFVNMKAKMFVILGYGIPKNIIVDENYAIYLKSCFNTVFHFAQTLNILPHIIFSGGPTDCYKPYKRTEAEEMLRFFKKLGARKQLNRRAKNWKMYLEKKSLSTLENLLFCKNILNQNKLPTDEIVVLCEKTREKRVGVLAKKVLGPLKVRVMSVDFDQSANRYLSKTEITKREEAALQNDLKALKSEDSLKKYHQDFVEKIKYLRLQGPNNQARTVREYWRKKYCISI